MELVKKKVGVSTYCTRDDGRYLKTEVSQYIPPPHALSSPTLQVSAAEAVGQVQVHSLLLLPASRFWICDIIPECRFHTGVGERLSKLLVGWPGLTMAHVVHVYWFFPFSFFMDCQACSAVWSLLLSRCVLIGGRTAKEPEICDQPAFLYWQVSNVSTSTTRV